jgi:dephospho-CoA kinase
MKNNPKIVIGFTGLMGSGKGLAVAYLAKKHGFISDALSNRVKEEILRKGEEINRLTLPITAGELREKYGPQVLAEKTWEKIIRENPQKVAIDGIRSPEEVEFFKNQPNFYLIALSAPQKLRFERLAKRIVPGRKEPTTWKEFLAAEKRDSQYGMNIPACIKLADFKIINEGTEEKLYQQLDKILSSLLS